MENSNIEQFFEEELQMFADNEQIDSFRGQFLGMHPYEQASFFIEMPKETRLKIYTYLSPEETADVMEHIELDDIKPLFTEMDPRFAAMVLAEMATDDAVDILNELEKDVVVSLLTLMDDKNASEIKELLHYEEKSAGSIMTTEFISVYEHKTVREVMQFLKAEAPEAETIYYLYVVDEDKHLVGVLSLRDLIISEPDVQIAEMMSEKVLSVSVAKDQEDVAQMIRDYDFLAMPVVDFQNHLLGIITVDDILDVMEEEASEDYSMLAGVSDMDRPKDSAFISAKKRLPWLVILLFLGILTASLIGQFERTLEQVSVLAIFIPLIAGMAGNTGTQALAVAVRGITTGDYGKQGKMKLVAREAGTGLINGIVCGILITVIVYFWQDDFFLGVLVGLSIMATLVIATLAGALVPMLMDRLKIDPAVASGPFITTINDIISVLIYFGLATTFMQYLV
ncbi:magnesium transporter [Lentibacillus amyloliquefaciens]|uniref:Magnesium transporter MgtE n=1 Tax=Lentibacillus amyloliquefaciens TaxID=1472767 RepID=A0A0U3NPG2_9BACI|nr:magnesium transporter [Lentibacillus amyloliquefaciens]ALX48619.1 magnesium transporter MgtE [Lentibacillus amyloliquefaciens]